MKRKLIKQGSGGFTVYLPKKWVESNYLTKGEEVDITESGLNLILTPKPFKVKKLETEIRLTGLTESLIRTLITNSYRVGYDKIKVKFDNEKQFNILHDVIKTKLIGFDIINKNADYCLVENVTEPDHEQFDNLIRKMFINIDSLFDITRSRLTNQDPKEDFNEIEERIIKYDNFCRRIIIKKKLIEKRSEFFWTFLSYVLHGQRELYHLNKSIKNKIKSSKKVLYLLNKNQEIFNIIKNSYQNKSIEGLSKIHDVEKELIYNTGYNLLRTKEGIIVYHLMGSIRQFYLSNSPLTGLIL